MIRIKAPQKGIYYKATDGIGSDLECEGIDNERKQPERQDGDRQCDKLENGPNQQVHD